MKTIGEYLRAGREKKRLTYQAVEAKTKIREKFLRALEENHFESLPSLSYAKGFVKNYADFLGLDTAVMLAVFRRQQAEASRTQLLPKGVAEPLNNPVFRLTPGRFMIVLSGVLVVVFLAYFGLQFRRILIPPRLLLESPSENLVITQKRVDVLGITDPDATVTINGISVPVQPDGKFFDQIALEGSETKIIVVSTSRYGKTTELEKTVIYQTGQ